MNRREALKILAAAPAAVLAPPVLAASREGKSESPKVQVVTWHAPLPRKGSQNLSTEELRQAFLNKWIPQSRR